MRPNTISEIPLNYKTLMEQCWNANPLERPDTFTLWKKMEEIKLYYQHNPTELPQLKANMDKKISYANASTFHSKLFDFNIPKNIDDFGQSSNQNNKRNSNVIEAGNTRLTKVFKKLRVNSKSVDIQNNYYRDKIQQSSSQTGDNDDDDDEYNNPNLHSEEQEEFEIPDEGF
ncbi:kinase-like domain-containing protein [Rhizophagus irregularis DAOM 181602=DAOM 197198]|nr:kinase-like domain-containing protein [Rhizophagus irregularis DAOM 181602=DAOM 197198]